MRAGSRALGKGKQCFCIVKASGRLLQLIFETSAAPATEQQRTVAPGEYHLNDELTLIDGNGNRVHGRINAERNEDGLYEVETDSPVNGKRVNLFSGEQLDGMVEPAVRAEVETENATEQTAAPQNTPATEPASAIQRVPVNEQTGEPMFEKTDTETALDALNEMTGADETTTAAIVDAQVEQAKKNLEALKKKKPVKKAVLKGTPMEMLKAQQEANAKHEAAMEQYNAQVTEAESAVNAWSNIQSLMKERKRAERAQTGTAPAGNAPQATQVEELAHGCVDGIAHEVGVESLEHSLARQDFSSHSSRVSHTRATDCLDKALFNHAVLYVERQLAGTLLRSAPANAVSKARNVFDFF